jgi:hypothetical protein
LRGIWKKIRRQTLKDYVVFPAFSGPGFPLTFAGNMTANLVRNLWSFTIIFCGHFPEGTQEFYEEDTQDESRGEWYFRQLLGSANLTGGQALPHPRRKPELSDRASPPSGPTGKSLRGNLDRGARDL